jgi:hypothetical protein
LPSTSVTVRGSYRPIWETGTSTHRYWVQSISPAV